MTEALLSGVRVADLAGEPAQMTGRILADLGAEVVKVEPPGGDPLRFQPPFARDRAAPEASLRFAAWNAGKASVVLADGDPRLAELLAGADVVLCTPGFPGALTPDPALAPHAVWVFVTPFGLDGPRAGWKASALGAIAASGNMYTTGDPDRAPLHCTEPAAYAHVGPEAAFAALTALASGRPQHVDVSIQETAVAANICQPVVFPKTGFRGRRTGAVTGRTQEIWRCKDGFVSFGLRGGKARVANLQTITRLVAEAGIEAPVLTERDWTAYSHVTATEEELRAIAEPIARYFRERTMAELYDIACLTNLMLAPCNSPREIDESVQLAARDFFGPLGDVARFPLTFVKVSGAAVQPRPSAPAPVLGAGPVPAWGARAAGPPGDGGAWAGTRIVEFGAGAAGPLAVRYFAENGATVVRIESKTRPDFMRIYGLGPNNPHGLEGSPIVAALSAGKRGVTLNLKHPKGIALAKRLILWADAVAENFAPKAMRSFGLDYDTLAAEKPDLVMISSCLMGQTGPHRDYPGFGGQGSALAGYNFLTGWPDREPIGPAATITDSLAPRFSAVALAAGLLYRRRTGRGLFLDLSQIEAAVYTLAPWMLDSTVNGHVGERMGNRSPRAVPHGVFPCAGDDRWVAVAAWTDDEWASLARVVGAHDPACATLAGRLERTDHVESAVAAWTRGRTPAQVAGTLQAAGVEAVPVQDLGDLHDDPQLIARGHFVRLDHPFMGEVVCERNGFRLSDAAAGYERPGPTLGQDNEDVLGEILGLSRSERETLAAEGALE